MRKSESTVQNHNSNQIRVPVFTAMIAASAFTAIGIFLGATCFQPRSTYTGNLGLPVELRADSAARGKGMSLATGQIDTAVEGLFVLDHLTGTLQCWVLNTRTGAVAARYQANVGQELEMDKSGDADFILTTGRFVFEGGVQGNRRPGRCVAYVADGNTGKVVGYGLRFNRQQMLQGNQQSDDLFVVCRGNTRDGATVRDQ